MKVDAIKEEWLTQVADLARKNLGKYGPDFSSSAFLAADAWTIVKLAVTESNTPELAILTNGRSLLRFETRGETLLCELTVEDPGGDAWIFHCRVVSERVELEKLVEGSVPKAHPVP